MFETETLQELLRPCRLVFLKDGNAELTLYFQPWPGIDRETAFCMSSDVLWPPAFYGKPAAELKTWPEKSQNLNDTTRASYFWFAHVL